MFDDYCYLIPITMYLACDVLENKNTTCYEVFLLKRYDGCAIFISVVNHRR